MIAPYRPPYTMVAPAPPPRPPEALGTVAGLSGKNWLLIAAFAAGAYYLWTRADAAMLTAVRSELSLDKPSRPRRVPRITERRTVYRTEDGDAEKVAKLDGEWHFFYDREWLPLRYYGGKGARVAGDKLVVQR